MEAQKIILQIWDYEERWNRHCQPGYNSLGLYTFRNITELDELEEVVRIQDKLKVLKRELRKEVGIFKYLWFLFSPITMFTSLQTK